eukprot:1633104-Pleurochrysis_carterae.AAC.2
MECVAQARVVWKHTATCARTAKHAIPCCDEEVSSGMQHVYAWYLTQQTQLKFIIFFHIFPLAGVVQCTEWSSVSACCVRLRIASFCHVVKRVVARFIV